MIRISTAQQGQWTWMKGDSTINGSPGHFGSMQPYLFDSVNAPNDNINMSSWKDLNGNFWLFGGVNFNILLNSLMEYNPSINQWAFMVHSLVGYHPQGIYGIENVGDSLNWPGARGYGAPTWVDTAGNLWIFGGFGYGKDSTITGDLNDLWKYHIATKTWTWVAGTDTVNDPGSYGTIMVPSSTNNPPSREGTYAAWVDNNNCLWMFGGEVRNQGHLSDLWKFDIATGKWTWIKGPNTLDQPAVYGTIGIPSSTNVPSGRTIFSHWKDSHDNFWLFGGSGPGNAINTLNDMWRYNPSTNEWTWMNGSNTTNNIGNGSTLCSSSTTFLPNSRYGNGACWTLYCDNFAFFGGSIDSTTVNNDNALWNYSVNSSKWTLMRGSIVPNDTGNFGVKYLSMPTNMPASRTGSIGWEDNSGNLWLFGGRSTPNSRRFSDLWRFVPDSSCPALCVGAGINEITVNKPAINVYPNPFTTTTTLYINGVSNANDYSLFIYNLLGQEIRSTYIGSNKEVIISRKDLPSGMYFYKLIDNTGSITTGKLMIED
jgi:hypothetical protein